MQEKAYNEPVHLISTVSEILNIHPQTLRQYEREGLIKPSRTNGKIRLYSQKDIDNIKYVLRLTRDYGINLAGVSYILEQNKKMSSLEKEIISYKENSSKSLIVQKSSFDIIVFEEE